MTRRWVQAPFPPTGGGEQTDAAPGLIELPRLKVFRNALLSGPGAVSQMPDWLLADTAKNLAGTPVEGHAVCGIFPFTQQGGATEACSGVAFSFNSDDNAIYLHQLAEDDNAILRTYVAYSAASSPPTGYTEAEPPQITGFEMTGKFYFTEYAREAATLRRGYAFFDPTGAGSITHPTFVLGGGPASVLKFRGISLHRGTSALGWGYRDEDVADIDQPHVLRFSKLTDAEVWVPNIADGRRSAGFIDVGTRLVPIIACGMAGRLTIIGKEQEVFALDGDDTSNFYTPRIGDQHGPVSTTGLVSIPDFACWLALSGLVVTNGQTLDLLTPDRVSKRFLRYADLTRCWGAHDSTRTRVVWAVRRTLDEDASPVSDRYPTELFWWDYKRNEFGAQGLPSRIFSVGVTRGPGQTVVGPTGVVSGITATPVGKTFATITWTPGDPNPDVTFQVEFKRNVDSTFVVSGTTAPGVYTSNITGLVASTLYDVRIKQIRNGQSSAYTTSTALFTTSATSFVPAPSSPLVESTDFCYESKGVSFFEVTATWVPFIALDPGVTVKLYQGTSAPPTTLVASGGSFHATLSDPTCRANGDFHFYRVRTEAADAQSAFVNCLPFPIEIGFLF